MSTLAGHSSRHILQLTHKSATALNSSLAKVAGSSVPAKTARIRLALARGELSSAGPSRKIGHIRTSDNCERQAPQPLQSRASSATSACVQRSCSWIGEAAAGSAAGSVVEGAPAGGGGGAARPIARVMIDQRSLLAANDLAGVQ